VKSVVLQLGENEIEEFVKKVNFEKEKGLVPVVVQDASNDRVLMQAYMDKDALRLTLASGRLHFWSRRRGRIWLKGEESGHHSLLQNAILDCDDDTILFKVQQIGTVCHTGQETCFHKPITGEKERVIDAKISERIFEVIVDRLKNPTKDSYVSRLTGKGEDSVLQKIGEETVELILATKGNRHGEIIHEATDILFHILVLLAQKGFELRRIFEELQHRHQAKTQTF
jgi:phosphoribosyl-ATP pyrophosphohydrolase/phosphoribosyl-AMP cyclohydrolase